MSEIEKVLLDATGHKPQKAGEDRQKFLVRLAVAANDKLSEEAWADLEKHKGVQEWVLAAIEADNKEKAVADFPDREDDAEEDADEDATADGDDENAESDDSETDEDEDVDTKPKKKAAKPAAKKGADKPAKAEKAGKAPAKKGADKPAKAGKAPAKKAASGKPSMRRALKMLIVKSPKLSVDELVERLVKKGYESPSKMTVGSIRADTRDTIKVLVDADLLELEV